MFGYYCICFFIISFFLNLISYYYNSKLMRIPWFICQLILKFNINLIIILNKFIYPYMINILNYIPYNNHIRFIFTIIYYLITLPWYCYDCISIIFSNLYIIISIIYQIFIDFKDCIYEIILLFVWCIYYLLFTIRGAMYVIHLIF